MRYRVIIAPRGVLINWRSRGSSIEHLKALKKGESFVGFSFDRWQTAALDPGYLIAEEIEAEKQSP